jgi:hypothetical protein
MVHPVQHVCRVMPPLFTGRNQQILFIRALKICAECAFDMTVGALARERT